MNTDRIRDLNDRFRRTFVGGSIMVTPGIRELPNAAPLLELVRGFDEFSDDPHREHDFGAIDYEGQKFFWKIDYYNRDHSAGSEDPSDPGVTSRVLTVMLASEY